MSAGRSVADDLAPTTGASPSGSLPERGLCWLASYPRSGNTLVRFLLTGLIDGPPQSSSDVNRRVPDLHKGYRVARPARGRHIVKTHIAYGRELPAREATSGFIYVLRDPLDVIASNWSYFLMAAAADMESWPAERRDRFRNKYVNAFIALGGEPRWFQTHAGSWVRNVTSWADGAAGRHPHLILRYEDLVAEPRREAARLSRFLNLTRSPSEIAEVVAAASYQAMRGMEEGDIAERRSDVFYTPSFEGGYRTGLRFVNRGQPGAGRELLSPNQIAAAEAAFGPLMRRFGYASPLSS